MEGSNSAMEAGAALCFRAGPALQPALPEPKAEGDTAEADDGAGLGAWGDILDPDVLGTALRGVDAVFHLAANPDARRGLEDPRIDLELEVLTTFQVLDSMRTLNVPRIIFLSSGTVYGDVGTLEVTEESEGLYYHSLATSDADTLLSYSKQPQTKPAVRDVIAKLLELRNKIEEAKKGVEAEQEALKEIADDQERIRKNIERAPKESETFKRYLKKFDDQETELEDRTAKLKAHQKQQQKAAAELAAFVRDLKAE